MKKLEPPKKPKDRRQKPRPDGIPAPGEEVSAEWIKEHFKGKQGGEESETTLADTKGSTIVTVYADSSTAAKIAQRCGSAFVKATWWPHAGDGGGVILQIDKTAFRGLDYAFKRVDNRGTWTGPKTPVRSTGDELDNSEAAVDNDPNSSSLFARLR